MAEKEMICHHWGGGHFLFTIGLVVIVYGLVQWAKTMYALPDYGAWILGGVLLIVVWWVKKSMWMK